MAHKNRAIVVGGGIAGTVAALALQKAGLDPVIFEAHPTTADGVGSWLTLAVNGVEALRAVDLEASTFGGFETPRMALRLGDGRFLAAFDNGPSVPRPGTVCTSLKRSDLYGALRRTAEERRIPIVHGKRLATAETTTDGVVALFEDGTTARGAFLIGADGVRSRVRTLIDQNAPSAQYLGLLNSGGYARGVKVDGEVGTMHMYFGKKCFYAYVPNPNGEVWWFANPAVREEPGTEGHPRLTNTEWRAKLLELVRDDASPVADVIAASEDVQVGWPSYDLQTVPVWRRGRMVIIGDAAHAASPSSGQGASMAIEDAVVLARSLRDANSVEAGFATYEAERRGRVERVVAQGRRNGSGKTPNVFGRVARDLALRMVFRGGRPPGGSGALQWLYDYDVAFGAPRPEGNIVWG